MAYTPPGNIGPVPIAAGGTEVTSVTTTPTATSWAGWDANANLSSNNFLSGFASTVTNGGTTTLMASSGNIQHFLGTMTETVVLPVTSTLAKGLSYVIRNLSTGTVTVNASDGSTVQAMTGSSLLLLTCISTSVTTNAAWTASYIIAADVSGAVLLNPTGPQTISTYGITVPTLTSTADSLINGLTVGKGGGGILENTAVGTIALAGANTGGGQNSAFGYGALNANTSGVHNTAIGFVAMSSTTTGGDNTAVGTNALQQNIAGIENTAFGYSALFSANSNYNSAFGSASLSQLTTGYQNTAIGYTSCASTIGGGVVLLTGSLNTCIGYVSGVNNAATSGAIAIGAAALGLIANGTDSPSFSIGSATVPVAVSAAGTIYSTATSSGGTLPVLVAGYMQIILNGTAYKIPLYLP